MTVKAGQKCTAIRRAFVPRERLDHVTDAVSAKLSEVVVGAPGAEGVTMGALVSLDQREDVRGKAAEPLAGTTTVFGDPRAVEVVGADAERGAFISPVLLRCDDPDVAAVHAVEAFGPVSTLLPYDSTSQVVDLVARGEAACSPAPWSATTTTSPREVVLGIASHHGRVLALDRDSAPESTGHGTPMPQLVHGGPGRAGGGEELGGVRAVLHHMQRTALQGSPDMLTAITGRWTTGSRRHVEDVDLFRKSLADLRIGDTVETPERTISLEDISHFADFTGDWSTTPTPTRTRRPRTPRSAATAARPLPRRVPASALRRGGYNLAVRSAATSGSIPSVSFMPVVKAGEHYLRHADRQADHPAHQRRLRRGAGGTAWSATRRTSRWRRTTCSRSRRDLAARTEHHQSSPVTAETPSPKRVPLLDCADACLPGSAARSGPRWF